MFLVPVSFRSEILKLGHERNGHLGGEKVAAMIGRYFLWPGMVKDVVGGKMVPRTNCPPRDI